METHSHNYNQKNTGSQYLKSAATCTSPAVYYYSCSCGEKGTGTFTSGSAAGHSYTAKVTSSEYLKTKATCTSPAVYYYSCSSCGAKGTNTFTSGSANGHSYVATPHAATCTEAPYTNFKCSVCGDTYQEEGVFSDWSTTRPSSGTIETKTQYRYRTKATKTQNASEPAPSGYTLESSGSSWKQTGSGTHYYFSRPGGFNSNDFTSFASSALSSYENSNEKRTVSNASHNSYIYWHWAYPYTYGVGTNCYISDHYGDSSAYNDSATVWEAFESASDVRWATNSDGTVRVSDHSNYSYNWFILETYKQTYTDYVKQNTYYKWSSWSAWQDSSVSQSSTREVETRTVYRSKTTALAEHSWNNGIITTPATETSTGVKTYTCSVCHGTKTETIPKLTPSTTRYTITFNPDNGQSTFTRQTGTDGRLSALPAAPEKSGYRFDGWYMGSAKVSTSTVFTANTTLKAKWTAKTTGSVEDYIIRMYSVCLGRNPSQDEIDYYIWEIDANGMTGTEIAYKFIFADEFLVKNYCDRHYAEALYKAFMGRAPSDAEIESKVYLLQQGQTREQVFNEFVTSSEYKSICSAAGIVPGKAISYSGKGTRAGGRCSVDGCESSKSMDAFNARLYSVVLDRQPAQNELDAWAYYLIHGEQTAKSAARYFLFSEEFRSHNYNDADFATYLYKAMLGREPDADGLAYWVWRLESTSREALFDEFAATDEFKLICQSCGIICE